MLFNSFEFLLFFPVVLLLYYMVPHRFRWALLLIGSYYFYMAHTPELAILLLISTMVDFWCGLKMAKAKGTPRKLLLTLSILVNIGILISFKYLGFFTSVFQDILSFFDVHTTTGDSVGGYNFNEILLPVGISFYTFQTLSYTIDVYRGKMEPETHLGKFALYVSFFPQLVAGPIERARRLLPQLKKKVEPSVENIKEGVIYMAWGFFLKLVVADRIGMYVDLVYADPELYRGLPLVLGSTLFGYQIYYDFSAYTAIAIGAAKTMGITLIHNFNRPFFSTSMASFWGRWHISFTQWIRDYLYKPLKQYKSTRVFSVLLIFFIIGLWHGANWTFVIWGLLNGIFLILEFVTAKQRKRLLGKLKISKAFKNVMAWIIIKGLLIFSLIFFRSPTLSDSRRIFSNMFSKNFDINIFESYFELFLMLGLLAGVQVIHYFKGNNRIHELFCNRSVVGQILLCILFGIVIVLFSLNKQNSFIYFQF